MTATETRKTCTGECRRLLPLAAFGPQKKGDGHRPKCRDCEAAYARQRRTLKPDFQARQRQKETVAELATRGLKRCARGDCQKVLPLDAFYVSTDRTDGRYPYCRECCAQIDASRRPKIDPAPQATSYTKAHTQLGPVADMPCWRCGRTAHEWAYDHGDPDELMSERGLPYSLDPSHYRPMCRKCHRRFDCAYRRELRLAAGWRAAEPRIVVNDCVICGEPFPAERKRIQSCSALCESALRSRRQVERQERARAERNAESVLTGRMARELAALAGIGAP